MYEPVFQVSKLSWMLGGIILFDVRGSLGLEAMSAGVC
jgi:hypothetical protein